MEDSLVLRALEALKRACKDLQGTAAGGHEVDEGDPEEEERDPCESPSMKALLVLQSESQDGGLLFADPALSTLCSLLSRLKSLYLSSSYGEDPGGGIGGLLSSLLDLHHLPLLLPKKRRRRSVPGRCWSNCREISRVAGSIESEIQSWIDRESLGRLVSALRSLGPSSSSSSSSCLSGQEEDALARLLLAFEDRLSRGFDRELQDAVLRSGVFPAVAAVLASPSAPARLRERCAAAVEAMVRFNRDVFVGHVLMGGGGGGDGSSSSSVLSSLATMGTPASMRVLQSLVAAIKIALVDEIHADGHIPRLVGFLSSPDVDMEVAALELLLRVAYYARKEAVDAMMGANVVKRLVALQRHPDLGGSLIEMDDAGDDDPAGGGVGRPFASCVARLAIQMEVGEGLRRREKAAAKLEILERVREAAASEAEAATIVAEVLWGASP